MGNSGHEPFSSEIEKTLEEKVKAYISTLYVELPQNTKETASGKHLLEISEAQIGNIKPPLESEGEIDILPGKVIALTGSNGAGKSTFFKSLLENNSLPEGLKHKPGLKIGYLPQEGDFSLAEDLSLEEFLNEMSAQIREANDWDFDDGFFNTGSSVLFKDALETKLRDLSGGEKTKLQMFILLLRKAELVFLDEPTNHIDQEGQALLTQMIQKLTSGETTGYETTFVISSHNQQFLQENCKDGALNITVSDGGRKIKQDKAYKPENLKNPKYNIPWLSDSSFTGTVYKGGNEKINSSEVYFGSIEHNSKIIMAGENGSGKTTFLKLLANLDSKKIDSACKPAYLPQEWPKEVLEGDLANFLQYLGVDEYNFTQGLEESGFFEKRAKGTKWLLEKFSSFSLGEQRFLWFLAVCKGKNSSFLLLDEPTNHLDAQLKAELIKAILDFPGAVLAVTHDKELMDAILQKIPLNKREFWLMQKGKGVSDSAFGIDEYFGAMARKAQQSINQLNK